MFLLDRRTVLQTMAASGLVTAAARPALAAPQATELFTADAMGGNVDSVVVMGEESALLIDTQFSPENATALADVIEASGRRLETVFITHAHPDHYSGLPIIRARFPDIRAYAHAQVAPLLPSADIGEVEALSADHLTLEGERLEVLDAMHGDTDFISPVHIPALDTLVAADMAYVDAHVWVRENTTPERIQLWRDNLDRLEAIGASTVIPGHRLDSSANDASVFAFTRDYLDLWETALAETSTADDLRAMLTEGRDGHGLAFAVDMAVGEIYPN